jgi:phosphonate transport system ATP-binding protein
MLEIENLTRSFGEKTVLSGVSLQIEKGAFVGVIGRSGAGKSTLLRLINRLIDPSAGRIVFEGEEVTALKGRQLRLWRARAAMIFQQFNLIGRLDVLTNVLMGRLATVPASRSLVGWWPVEDKAVALAAHRADHLSGGQQQRVAIARALVQEPDIVLADEPTASLDPHNTRVVMDALQRINKHFGITVIVNLHSLELARSYCDRLVGMAAGGVVFDDATAALTDAAARELYGIAGDAGHSDAAPADAGFPVGAVGQTAI